MFALGLVKKDPVEIFGIQGGESQFLYGDRRQPYVTSVRNFKKHHMV